MDPPKHRQAVFKYDIRFLLAVKPPDWPLTPPYGAHRVQHCRRYHRPGRFWPGSPARRKDLRSTIPRIPPTGRRMR